MVDFSTKDLAVETIEQSYFTVDPERKFDLLAKLIEREKPQQAIVFCRTKRGTDKVCRRLSELFKGVDTIHGDLQQSARDRVMRHFREGKTKVLVATDVVGRGIDVTTISHIINYDIPQFCDDYVHRVGRTGRMGREGIAFTFVTSRGGKRTDADRDADQPPVEAGRDTRLRGVGQAATDRGFRRRERRAAGAAARKARLRPSHPPRPPGLMSQDQGEDIPVCLAIREVSRRREQDVGSFCSRLLSY